MDFSFINKKINILVVDDDPIVLENFEEYLNYYPPYQVTTASSMNRAKDLIQENNRYHACLMDLGLQTNEYDEFYLLRRYGGCLPFIIVSGSTCLAKGAQANNLGAFEVLQKPIDLGSYDFIHIINRAVIKGLFMRKRKFSPKSILNETFDVLVKNETISMAELAQRCVVSDSSIRKMWHKAFGLPPKQVSMIFKYFQTVFDYFVVNGNNGISWDAGEATIHLQERIRTIERYYMENPSIFNVYIKNQLFA